MNRRIRLLIAALVAVGAAMLGPGAAIANAGCNAVAGSVQYNDSTHIYLFGGLACPINTGSNAGTWEVRAYMQVYSGGVWAILPSVAAIKKFYTNPGNGALLESNYGTLTCSVARKRVGSLWRPKFVVVRPNGSTSTAVGTSSTYRC
jgi:hypothetical protein